MRQTVDLRRAREQHAKYRAALSELGLEVISLERDDIHPDSCFVEDTAVVHEKKALICRLAPGSRRGEEDQVVSILKHRLQVKRATAPATIEGGDVMHLSRTLVSGLTQRTNLEGVRQAQDWLEIPICTISDMAIVHLKSYVTFLGKNTALCTSRFKAHSALKGLELLLTPEDETYAANTLTIAGTVLMSTGRPKATRIVREAGFDVRLMDTSEFEKCEGALTCLSLII